MRIGVKRWLGVVGLFLMMIGVKIGLNWILGTIYISQFQTRLIINGAYVVSFLIMLFVIKVVDKRPCKAYGLFLRRLPQQLILGILLSAAICGLYYFLLTAFGDIEWFEYSEESIKYTLVTQFLVVAFTEELLFRGMILTYATELFASRNYGVFISAVLFSAAHGPGIFFLALIFGLLCGVLRVNFPKYIGVISLTIIHGAWNVMNTFMA